MSEILAKHNIIPVPLPLCWLNLALSDFSVLHTILKGQRLLQVPKIVQSAMQELNITL
jgi:hypothetical protein